MSRFTLTPRDGVDDHHFDKANDLLDALGPRHTIWSNRASDWIYRGQADANWVLKPAAARDPHVFKRFGVTRGNDTTWEAREILLNDMLARFREGLDRLGLVIPLASPRILRPEFNSTSTGVEPAKEAFPLMALAQHHGLPTILLDWSRRASVAAYFAAVDAADRLANPNKGLPGATHLAVWALERGVYKEFPYADSILYQAPGGTNPNLSAQAGLFTIHYDDDDPSLEVYLHRQRAAQQMPVRTPVPNLRRLTLPVAEAGRLVRLLAEEGIDGASMFPSADGAVRAMRERALWA